MMDQVGKFLPRFFLVTTMISAIFPFFRHGKCFLRLESMHEEQSFLVYAHFFLDFFLFICYTDTVTNCVGWE